ncbi:MAG: hypothetical protein RIG77_14645 [Cyclobacteriaceae bacterium]
MKNTLRKAGTGLSLRWEMGVFFGGNMNDLLRLFRRFGSMLIDEICYLKKRLIRKLEIQGLHD